MRLKTNMSAETRKKLNALTEPERIAVFNVTAKLAAKAQSSETAKQPLIRMKSLR